MAPSPWSDADLDALFALADEGVRAGLHGRRPPEPDPASLAPALREPHGAFVTLEVDGELNGCIGTIESDEPLGLAVPRLAWAAAFADPRLPQLTGADYPSLDIKLSLLSPLEPLPAGSEAELVAALRPGIDGVLIRGRGTQATFLPAVWPKLGDPLTFVRHLEDKAGLRPGHWPAGMQAWRYTAEEHHRRAADISGQSSSAA